MAGIDNIIDSYYLAIEKSINKLESLITLYVGGIPEGVIDPVLNQVAINSMMTESGYYNAVQDLMNNGYQDAIDSAFDLNKAVVGADAAFTELSLTKLTTMKKVDLLKFNQLADDFAVDINRGITNVSLGIGTKPELVAELRDALAPKLKQYSETWVRTGMSANYREASMDIAEDMGIKKFRYEGAISANTRDFCRRYVGQIRTRDEWDSLNNNQINPVSVYGGGYNCQHRLRAVA